MTALAWLDGQRQIVTIDAQQRRRALTAETGVMWASWGRNDVTDVHSWPAWSPDGRRIAAFRIGRDGSDARAVVCDVSGVASVEGTPLGGRLPIYLQWAPEGDALAVLFQEEDELLLDRLDAASPDRTRTLLRGSPLFFSWLDHGRIAAFVGEKNGPIMLVLSPDGERTQLPGIPGNFCAPVKLGAELAYVAHHRGRVTILLGRPHGTGIRELEIVDGLVALVGSPDGTTLARAVAPDGDGSPYRDLRLLDPRSGRTRSVSDADCMAFFWANQDLIVARKHRQRGTIAWMRVSTDGRSEELIAELYPSRDLRFWLRFFEQYCHSHPIVDPEGTTLLLSGGLVGGPDPQGTPRVWAVPIRGGSPEELGPGWFGTFAPR